MAHQKILLFELTDMIGDLIEGVLADEDVEFVRARDDFVSTVARERPDIAVVQIDHVEPSLRKLLEELPRVRFLALAGTGERADLYHVEPTRIPLTNVSPLTLRGALRIGREPT